jgi:Domain of unknown function (DUF4388)/FHA domain
MADGGQILCSECRFPNLPSSLVCLQCKALLRSDQPLGYLCCDPFDAVALVPGAEVVLGRAKGCHMTLPHNSLSRQHAVVKVGDREMLYEDRSSNGSTVNGRRVKHAKLSIGDVITLGPFEVTVQATIDDEEVGGGTVSMDFHSRISGLIEDEPLLQTLQGLEFNSRSGTLEVHSGRLKGTIAFNRGTLHSAEVDGQAGEEAVLQLLGLVSGRFVFTPGHLEGERAITKPLTALLLEFSRRMDEDPPTSPGC